MDKRVTFRTCGDTLNHGYSQIIYFPPISNYPSEMHLAANSVYFEPLRNRKNRNVQIAYKVV